MNKMDRILENAGYHYCHLAMLGPVPDEDIKTCENIVPC
jgi:hypothetical protein